MRYCPSKSVKDSEHFKKHVEALGEPLTYFVYSNNSDKDGGHLLSEGKTADIYKQIFDKVNDEILAIKLTAKIFGSNVISETKPTEETQPTVEEMDVETSEEDALFRYADTTEDYEVWDREKEEGWFKENFPNVDIKVLDDLSEVDKWGGDKAWGLFKAGITYIKSTAKVGTTYHEAFHVVFHMYLNDTERNAILDEIKQDTKLTDLAAEELLADKFMQYVMSQEAIKPRWQKVLDFFKRIYQVIKYNLTGVMTTDLLFRRMNNKYYANKQFTRDISAFKDVMRRRTEGLTYQEEFDRASNVADAVRRYLDKQYLNYPNKSRAEFLQDFLNSVNEDTGELGIDIALKKAFKGLKQYYDKNKDNLSDYKKKQFSVMLNNIFELDGNKLPTGQVTPRRLGDLALRQLAITEGLNIRTKGTNFNGIDNPNDSELSEINEEEIKLEGWQVKNIETSRRSSASSEIKKELSYLEQKDSKGNNKPDSIGLPKYHNAAETYATLIKEMSDLYKIGDMIASLKEFVKFRPEYAPILDKLENNEKFRTLFYNAFQNTHAPFRIMIREYDKAKQNYIYKWIHSNSGSSTGIIDQWKNDYYNSDKNSLINSEGEFQGNEELEKLFNDITKVDTKEESIDNMFKVLNGVGIEVTKEELDTLSEMKSKRDKNLLRTFWKNINPILKYYFKGENPYEQGREETKQLNTATYLLSQLRPQNQESSLRNVSNKTVYSNILSFFVSKQMKSLKNKDVRERYLKDPFYKKMPWLNRMNSEQEGLKDFYQNQFEYTILNGKRWEDDNAGTEYSSMSEADLELTRYHAFRTSDNFAWYHMPTLADAPTSLFIKGEKLKVEDAVTGLYQAALGEWARITSETPIEITNYNDDKANKEKFHFVPVLNKHKDLFENPEKNKDKIKEIINEYLQSKVKATKAKYEDMKIMSKLSATSSTFEKDIESYVYNSFFANTQMIALFQGDPAFYKNSTDFFKRAKEVWSPGILLDTDAKYEREGKETITVKDNYNTVYVNDEKIFSTELAQDILDGLLDSGINKVDAYKIAAKYGLYSTNDKEWLEVPDTDIKFKTLKTNVTDAQAFISLERYREIQIGLGRWNDNYESNYDNLKQGKVVDTISMQPVKPFMFTHRFTENLVIPTQNKNSEFVLLPALAYRTKEGVQIPTEQDRIDEYKNFESPKLARILDLMQRDSYTDKNNKVDSVQFESAVKVGLYGTATVDTIDNATIHSLSNSDYRLQQETPDHFTDDEGLIGTQLRKLIVSDISEEAQFVIQGIKDPFSKQRILEYYQDIVTADIVSGFNEVSDRFKNLEDIQKLLLEEVRRRGNNPELEEALEIKNGKFNLPLFHPIHSRRVESLLSSVFKNKIVRQKAPGGNLVQVSGVGFMNNLKVKVKDGKLQHLEVMLPFWMKEKFSTLADENGKISAEKLKEHDLDRLIGYRIPTEDKYSMLPLRIVGFLPRESGGGIMLPAEITTITGSDFDVDKMYVHLPAIYTKRYDKAKAKRDFERVNKGVAKLTQDILNQVEESDITDNEVFNAWWRDNKNNYLLDNPELFRAKYDNNKTANENSKEARNNAKLDITWSILTNKDTFSRVIKPGNFDDLESLMSEVNDILNPEEELDIADPLTTLTMFSRNMAGKALIGIFANHNVNHAILQHSKVAIDKEVSLNGFDASSMHELKNEDARYISGDLAQYLAAVVDNAKNPISAYLNINMFTADIIAYMTRLGFSMRTVIGFMNQPVIRELAKEYILEGGTPEAYDDAFKNIRTKLTERGAENIDTKDITQDKLFEYINKQDSKDYNNVQLSVLDLFDRLREDTFQLGKIVRITRADNINRQLTMASNEIIERDFKELDEQETFTNINTIWEGMPMMKSFYDYAVTKTSNVLSEHFLWKNKALVNTKDVISKNLTGNKRLSKDQLEAVNYELLWYLTGDYFKPEEIYKGDMSKREYMVKKFPSDFTKYLDKNPELKSHELIKRLLVESKKVNNTPYDQITFKNIGSLTDIDRATISKSWLDLLESEKYSKFAEHLIMYTMMTNGFHITPKSFGHLIPVDYFSRTENSFNDKLRALQETTKNDATYKHFAVQFLKNNWQNEFYVPAIDVKRIKEGLADSIHLNKKTFKSLKNNIKKTPGARYITVVKDGRKTLYELDTNLTSKETYVYNKTTPLGIKNISKEYAFEQSITSVFPSNLGIKERAKQFTKPTIEQGSKKNIETTQPQMSKEDLDFIKKLQMGQEEISSLTKKDSDNLPQCITKL